MFIEKQPTKALSILPPDLCEEVLAADRSERWGQGVSIGPSVFKGYVPIFAGKKGAPGNKGLNQHAMHYLTPETRSTSHYWWSISNDGDQAGLLFRKIMLEWVVAEHGPAPKAN